MATSVIRRHYKDLSEILCLSQDTLVSLSGSCYQAELIDLQTNQSITTSTKNVGAGLLLVHLQLKIKQSPDYLPVVLRLMAGETALKEMVRKMEAFAERRIEKTGQEYQSTGQSAIEGLRLLYYSNILKAYFKLASTCTCNLVKTFFKLGKKVFHLFSILI